MQDLAIFSIASQRDHWLAARSAALASNIANADTPGYRARDVAAFDAALASAGAQMSRTSTGHLLPQDVGVGRFETAPREGGADKHSGNTVSLETELMSLGDVRSQHAVVTGVVGAFHRMLMSTAKA